MLIKRKFRHIVQVFHNDVVVLNETSAKIGAIPDPDFYGMPHIPPFIQQFDFTIYDRGPEDMKVFYEYLAKVYNFSLPDQPSGNDVRAKIVLTRVDGVGNPTEEWTMKECYPTSINFGDLDFSSSDMLEISVNWRIKGVQYKKINTAPFKADCVEIIDDKD